MRKHVLLAIVILAALTGAAFGLIKRYTAKAQQSPPAAASESLRDRARRQHEVVAAANPANLRRYDQVATLARDSTAIVVGSVDSLASSLLPPNENFIVTDYQVSIQEVLKGKLKSGGQASVRGPGGQVKFDDGSSAKVTLPYYWNNPQVGKTYVLFLNVRHNGQFVLTGGPQGLFEVTAEDKIAPQARGEDQLTQTYNGLSKDSFVEEIRKSLVKD